MSWNADLSWWSGSAEFAPGHLIDLHIKATNDPAQLRAAVARAEPLWQRLRETEPSVRTAVAEQMTAAHNEYCDPDDEVTPGQFANRIRLLSAKFEPSNAMELVYADGMLFGGHWIIVPVDAAGVVRETWEAG